MAKPKITVVTCTYNVDYALLRKALESVETQTFTDIEHLFNDSSNDPETLKIIEEYTKRNKDRYSIKMISTPAKGIGRAMNDATKEAQGELINFLHADDYYYTEDALEKVAAYFKENDDIVWLTGNLVAQVKGQTFKLPVTKVLSLDPKKALSTMIWISHENTFMKTELIGEYGWFNEDNKNSTEYGLWLRLIRDHEVFIVDDYFTVYTVHKGSKSTGSFKAYIESLLRLLLVLKEEKVIFGVGPLEENPLYKALKKLELELPVSLKRQ